MPFKSQAQRGLFYAAAAKKGGVDGVSQKTAKEMVADDKPGLLPERKGKMSALYKKKS